MGIGVYKTKTGKWQTVLRYRDENRTPRKKNTFEFKREAHKDEFDFCVEEKTSYLKTN